MRKGLKKLVAVVLTAEMALSFSMPAFAAVDETEPTNNANENFCITETTTLVILLEIQNLRNMHRCPMK